MDYFLNCLFPLIKRRTEWFSWRITFRKLLNMAIGSAHFVCKSKKLSTWPFALKIDITPLCNLRCTLCVHAHPNGNKTLEKQTFNKAQMMSLDQFQRIINEIKSKSNLVSLYYFGEPLMHPDLDAFCRIAYEAGLNVHYSTNFSFLLTDERIQRIVKSGVTHITVCVDGLSQGKYQLTRVGGRIDWVLSNLKRLCQYKREGRQRYPMVEVQYLKFQHNLDELEKAKRIFKEIGVDKMIFSLWGILHNYTDEDPGKFTINAPRKKRLLPQCFWPYFSIVIKYNGDVIPCCMYRHGQQYTATDNPVVLGNIFSTNIREVWNSQKYREVRRLVANPELIESDSSLKENFCYGCHFIFDTDISKVVRFGDKHTFHKLYSIGKDGIPIRNPIP